MYQRLRVRLEGAVLIVKLWECFLGMVAGVSVVANHFLAAWRDQSRHDANVGVRG